MKNKYILYYFIIVLMMFSLICFCGCLPDYSDSDTGEFLVGVVRGDTAADNGPFISKGLLNREDCPFIYKVSDWVLGLDSSSCDEEVIGFVDLNDNELKDTDGDGLLDKDELVAGTSVNNPDTDGDTVPDGVDEHPLGGDRLITKNFKWKYRGVDYEWNFGVSSDVFNYYNNLDRVANGVEYVTYNDPIIKKLAEKLEQKAEENDYNKAEFATVFVQHLPYLSDTYTGFDGYPKYPIQTLVDGSGDCEDSSYLAAALIAAMNIDVILINPEGHMAIGVWCEDCSGVYWECVGRKYYYLETTNPGWELGEYPDRYSKNAKLYSVFGRF